VLPRFLHARKNAHPPRPPPPPPPATISLFREDIFPAFVPDTGPRISQWFFTMSAVLGAGTMFVCVRRLRAQTQHQLCSGDCEYAQPANIFRTDPILPFAHRLEGRQRGTAAAEITPSTAVIAGRLADTNSPSGLDVVLRLHHPIRL